jgi:glycine hydroxymethyltransferase
MPLIAGFISKGVSEAARNDGQVSDTFADQMRAQIAEFLAEFPAPGL